MSEAVLTTVDDGVATITLNRPEVLNAGNRDLLGGLRTALESAEHDDAVDAIILTGAGRGFCAGADLAAGNWWPDGLTIGEGVAWVLEEWWNPCARAIAGSSKPTVAAVNGVAAGGGIGLALACDIVVAAESASFVQVFGPQLALVPDVGSTWWLPRLIGPARARGLMMLGDKLPAPTAKEWGLIWECVPDGDLVETTRSLAGRLGSYDREAMRSIRAILDGGLDRSFDEQLDVERDENGRLPNLPGFMEGMAAFIERRPPDFRTAR
jgi:2-(1,2-epoxy-1,2-dihydrophenyl)acetyl-CoA isomerase